MNVLSRAHYWPCIATVEAVVIDLLPIANGTPHLASAPRATPALPGVAPPAISQVVFEFLLFRGFKNRIHNFNFRGKAAKSIPTDNALTNDLPSVL